MAAFCCAYLLALGTGNTASLITIPLLYGEFVWLLRLWGQKVHSSPHPLQRHGLVRTRQNGLELSGATLAAFFAFGLVALLYLVTEEILVEAHEIPDTPLTTAIFFVGFLLLIVIEEMLR